ncbi:ketoacyl-ACP synthase III [Skermania sp. ID1734]|uniref:beta-ketoacyl-ACP synthase III n=1 Tax=Skermania sp. ID1734 TaxID=2597516 RepID=UPI00117F0371|nr:beta-ketoacyl-ACP synthase III [Skermania sp. ID1734]TSD99419.1 ketoacyl-ACP synthase III [Skermania sp. ID1734]
MPAQIASTQGVEHTRMLGLGVYRPRRVVPNSEIVDAINSSDEWIKTRSGIETRRFAEEDETIIGMSVEASRRALDAAGLAPDQIDCVIVATSSRLVLGPAAAPQVATQLGMNDCAGFDLAAGCSGFDHALAVGSDMIRAGTARHVLVIGVERLSDLLDRADRTCAFIFADGAGAVVVGPSDEVGIGPVAWGSDGSQWHAIRQDKDFGTYFDEVANNAERPERPYIRMEGTAVFRWVVSFLEKACHAAVDKAGLTMEDLDVLVPHQANLRITDVLVRALKLPPNIIVAKDIIESGNASAASIPMAMEQLLASGQAKPGQTALLMGFGAGLAYAGQVVKLPPISN